MHAERKPDGGAVARSVGRGIVAAMAMTGMRRVTRGLGLVPEPPPEEIARQVPRLLARIPPERRDEAIELAHWAYGAAGGAAFGALPEAMRRAAWSGPAWGIAAWTLFERVVAPVFGLRPARQRPVGERLAVLGDHLLYGVVVAGRSRRP